LGRLCRRFFRGAFRLGGGFGLRDTLQMLFHLLGDVGGDRT